MTSMSEVCNKLTMDRDSGFTLVELLVTLVVVSILLAAGAPAFQDFIKNNRVTGQTNDLVSAIQLARSEALKRGVDTVVCASKDQKTCTNDKDTWVDGWIVFSDLNRDGAPNKADGGTPITGTCQSTEDCIMKTSKGLSQGSTLTTAADFLCFLPTGLSGTHVSGACSSDSADAVDFTIKAKNCEKTQARKVSVTQMGHTSVATVGCS
jgi:type IV fimbrial biogenesis protein FimT